MIASYLASLSVAAALTVHRVDPALNEAPFLTGQVWRPRVELVTTDVSDVEQARIKSAVETWIAKRLKKAGISTDVTPRTVEVSPVPGASIRRSYSPTIRFVIVVTNHGLTSCSATAHDVVPTPSSTTMPTVSVVWTSPTVLTRHESEARKIPSETLATMCTETLVDAFSSAVKASAQKPK